VVLTVAQTARSSDATAVVVFIVRSAQARGMQAVWLLLTVGLALEDHPIAFREAFLSLYLSIPHFAKFIFKVQALFVGLCTPPDDFYCQNMYCITRNNKEVLGSTNRLLSFNCILSIWQDTNTAYKTPGPAVLLLLRVHSLPRERVYRAVA
jgi:hypothetical protein